MVAQQTQGSAIRERGFVTLWAATAASNLGDGIWLLAAPLLAASLTRDPLLIAGLTVAQRLPWLLFGLIGGALADRLDRRRTMVIVASVRATLVATLGLTVITDRASLPLLYVVFFVIALGETLFDTSAAAMLPAVVTKEHLTRANAWLASTFTVTNQFVGPALGGALFAATRGLPFVCGAIGLIGAAVLLTTLPGTYTPLSRDHSQGGSIRDDIAEGMRWLWRQRLLRTTALAMAVLNLTLVAQVSIMVLYAEERLGLGPRGYGLLVIAYGAGGVVGGLVARRMLTWTGDGTYLRLAIVIEGLVPAALALTRHPLVAGAILAIFGVHAIVWGALLASLRQTLTPDRLRGRVSSVHTVIEHGTGAPGALLGGVLAAQLGLTAPFWLGAAAGLLLLPFVWSTYSPASLAAARNATDDR